MLTSDLSGMTFLHSSLLCFVIQLKEIVIYVYGMEESVLSTGENVFTFRKMCR